MRSIITLALLGAALFAPAPIDSDAVAQSSEIVTVDAASIRTSVVGGYETDTWTMTLQAGVHYTFIVDGDGDSDLDVFLIDENGGVVDSDTDYTDFCVVEVIPRWTGPFELEVRNLGRRANLYQIQMR